MQIFQIYEHTVIAMGAMALLMFVQLLIADVVGLRAKHTPGGVVPVDHKDMLFRSTRTVANTNESVSIFLLACVFAILSGAPPMFTGYAACGFVLARAVYALCYYSNLQLLRSVFFGVASLALAVLLGVGFSAWI